ncbi:hypothetical protein SAY87_001168 [Trapa incisa]|uniref:protein-serine/threonine phosphatase n=1 Tax=Trapa incisa TaxID=236973 RepID=A0AAN7JH40_9MYRT|nr:hypothetical protein SAY87_001168 [Trapa incisa]
MTTWQYPHDRANELPRLLSSLFWRTPPFSPLTVPAPLSSFPSPIAPQPRTGLLCKDRGSSVLERKRPPVIAVPTGFFFSAADAAPEKAEEEVVEEGDGYGVYSKRGKNRGRLEDRHSAIPDLGGDPDQAFFGVFDGHGGAKAADFSAKNLGKNIVEQTRRRIELGVEERVKKGYLETDSEFIKEDVGGGSCCVTALMRDGDLIVSNLGDCRAVLSRGGTAGFIGERKR